MCREDSLNNTVFSGADLSSNFLGLSFFARRLYAVLKPMVFSF